MEKTTKLILVGVTLLLLVGCGSTTKQSVRRSEILSPTGQPLAAVAQPVVVSPQYVDPYVAQARAIGQQQVQEWYRWRQSCSALRQANPAANCRNVLGNEPDLTGSGSYYGGRGSILSTPGIIWIK